MWIRASSICAITAALGCASLGWDHHDPAEVYARTTTEYDRYKKITTVRAPQIYYWHAGHQGSTGFVRCYVPDIGGQLCQLYVTSRHRGRWHFYDHAYDLDGERHEAKRISSDVDCRGSSCTYEEDVVVALSSDYIEKLATKGLEMKLTGNGGEFVVGLPAGYMDGLLQRLREMKATPASPAR